MHAYKVFPRNYDISQRSGKVMVTPPHQQWSTSASFIEFVKTTKLAQLCMHAYVNHFEISWNPLHSIHKHQNRLINSCLPTHIQKYTNHLCFAINWSKFGWNLRIYLLVLRVVVRICRKNRDSLLCISATHSRLNLENQLRMGVQYKIYRVGCIGVYLERCKIICGIWRSLVHESLEFFVFIIQLA